MSDQPQWLNMVKKAPAWISGAISFITAVIGFVLLIRGNIRLGVIVLGLLAVIFILGGCLYLIYSRTEPLVEGGRGVYQFEKYRRGAKTGIGLVVGLIAVALLYKPSRFYLTTHVFNPSITSTATNGSESCTPASFSELPPHTIAVIKPIKSEGIESRASYSSLRLEHMSGLRLSSGIMVEFEKMKRFELFNPGFTTDFAADIVITFLDCTTHEDRIQSESGSYLTADTELGPLELHILKVQWVEFQW